MTRFKYIATAIFISLLLQTTLVKYISFNGIKPLLLVAVSICAVLNFGLIAGTTTGIISGLLLDITSGNGVGLSALILMYVCIICGVLCPKIFKEKLGVVVIFTFISNFIYGFLYAFFVFFAWGKGNILFIVKDVILIESILTAIVSIPIFLVFKKVKSVEWTND